MLNLCTERLYYVNCEKTETDHARPCFRGTSLLLFLKVPEEVNWFSQIASYQTGIVISQF